MSRGRVRGFAAFIVAVLVPAGSAHADHGTTLSVQLPAPAVEGQRAISEATIQTTIDEGAVSLQRPTRGETGLP